MKALLAVYDSDGLGLLCLNKHAAVPNRTDGRALNSQGLVNTALIGLPSWRMIIKMIQDLHPAPYCKHRRKRLGSEPQFRHEFDRAQASSASAPKIAWCAGTDEPNDRYMSRTTASREAVSLCAASPRLCAQPSRAGAAPWRECLQGRRKRA